MKKILFALSAVALLLVVGCSKEDIEIPAPDYKLVVNMDKPSLDGDTRAPRSSWKDGDEVYVLFNGDLTLGSTEPKYLKLTFNDSAWTPTWVGTTLADVAAKGSGNLFAGYVDGRVRTPEVYIDEIASSFASLWISYQGNTEGLCVMFCDNGTYTVDGNTVTLSITMKPVVNQITITNISIENASSLYVTGIDVGTAEGVGFIYENSVLFAYPSIGTTGSYYRPYANEDGVAFYFTSTETNATSLTLKLRAKIGGNYRNFTKIVSGAAIDFSTGGKSIRVVGPSGTEGDALNGWDLQP